MLNDAQGRLQKIEILGDGEIVLAGNDNSGRMQSGSIEIVLDSETQIMRTIRSRTRGTLTSKGKDNLSVSGDSMLATYAKDGTLGSIQAQKKCSFKTDDFMGDTDTIHYDAAGGKIDISGKNSSIRSSKNVFTSSHFLIQTRTRHLSTQKGVKATLVPGKKNVLLAPGRFLSPPLPWKQRKKGRACALRGM